MAGSDDRDADSLRAGVYEHYKGGRYLLVGVAKHSETGELLAAYIPLYAVEGVPLTVRPLDMFLDTVEIEGESRPRFRHVGAR